MEAAAEVFECFPFFVRAVSLMGEVIDHALAIAVLLFWL
jgi:hypothetical protein